MMTRRRKQFCFEKRNGLTLEKICGTPEVSFGVAALSNRCLKVSSGVTAYCWGADRGNRELIPSSNHLTTNPVLSTTRRDADDVMAHKTCCDSPTFSLMICHNSSGLFPFEHQYINRYFPQ